MSEENLALKISRLLYDKKAEDILALRVAHLTALTDYLVLCTGHNAIQVKALTEHVEEQLSLQGVTPRRVEGRADGSWVVMDYLNVIVHIFSPEARGYYRLERLWGDGQNRMDLPFVKEAESID